jgi:butyryl-CoA dehydrogenase
MLAGHWLGFTPLQLFCNPSQRGKYFPRLRSELAAFSLTEPAARGLVYRAAYDYDVSTKEVDRISSVAKLFATEVAIRTTVDSIQIHGGVGLMREYSIERMLRDAKTIQNLGETNLIQKALIGGKITS